MEEMVLTKRSLHMKDPLRKKNRKIAVTIKLREPVVRKTGKEDFSDYSELMQYEGKAHPIQRGTLLTKAVALDLETFIVGRSLGLREACILAGVNWNTFQRWRSKYPDFDMFIDKCLAEQEADALKQVQVAGRGGVWQASAWYLERRYPSKYGKRDMMKQEIYWKHLEFMKIVLEEINNADPALKATIVNRLRSRKINIGDKD